MVKQTQQTLQTQQIQKYNGQQYYTNEKAFLEKAPLNHDFTTTQALAA